MKKKVLIFNRFAHEVFAKARTHKALEFSLYDVESSKDPAFRAEVEAVLIRSGTSVNANFVKQYPNLKFVGTSTSGFDHLDLKLLHEKNICAVHAPEPPVQSVAELTFFLMLGALRRFKKASAQVRKGQWQRSALVGECLTGKTLGLVGCGRIGQRVSQLARAWGLEVIGFDPYLETWPDSITPQGYEEVLKASDILSFHVPLTRETRFMLNRATLEKVSTDVLIVNTSRGLVIQEDDLVQFLSENPEACAALDVFNSEPLAAGGPLQALDNVFLSPHIGASTDSCLLQSSLEAYEQVCDFFEGKKLDETLPPQTQWWSKNS